jgi:uncharacterized membrane protein YoaK (UPF0700 family)
VPLAERIASSHHILLWRLRRSLLLQSYRKQYQHLGKNVRSALFLLRSMVCYYFNLIASLMSCKAAYSCRGFPSILNGHQKIRFLALRSLSVLLVHGCMHESSPDPVQIYSVWFTCIIFSS